DNNTCINAIGAVIPGGGSYSCSWQSTFPAIDPHTTYSEHDIVTVTGVDDDNAGPSSQATASADALVLQAPPLAVTDSSLCTFDTNRSLTGNQYNRLLTQNASSFPNYAFTAT